MKLMDLLTHTKALSCVGCMVTRCHTGTSKYFRLKHLHFIFSFCFHPKISESPFQPLCKDKGVCMHCADSNIFRAEEKKVREQLSLGLFPAC